ncbi:FHA domain-containing protein [Haliangium ochraceum]|nr:FHA domain-containing protein [Haliangium ochraceum]
MTRYRGVRCRTLAAYLAFAMLLALAAPARAQQIDVELSVQDSPPIENEDGDKEWAPPTFRAVIIGAIPGLAAEQFVLRQEDAKEPFETPADKVKSYTESDDRMALVVLIQGDERWMGNETYLDEEDPDRLVGAYVGLGPSLDALATAGPPGSRAGLLIYAAGKAEPRQAMGEATQLSASALGQQKDYATNIGIPLLVGLDEAINIFDQHPGYRKILVVVGDGTGQEEDISAGLKDRVDKLKQRKVETFTIHYESIASGSPVGQNNMKKLGYTEAKHATSRDNFDAFAKQFVEYIGARYYATFPACNSKEPRTCFEMDNEIRDFVVIAGDIESDILSVKTPGPPPKEEESSLWWLWLLLGLLAVVLIVVIVVKVRNRPPPEPVFVPAMEVPMPEPGPGPKTMAIDTGLNSGGLPMVGWIVPLTGPNQFQTFKLMSGVTKMGSGHDCNVVIDDQFMSHYHAEIVASPMGFTLKDGGSTNGTYVNDRRVSTHELVDNDMLTMGKTNFKFKSIN